MNYMKTAVLLAGMTALFIGIGYMIGGQGGMLMALVFSVGHERVCLLEFRQDGTANARCHASQ
jgi:hypothetical protein